MANVAELGIKVTYDSMGRARDEFGRFIKGAEKAEESVGRFSKTTRRMNSTLASTVGKLGSFAAAYVSIAGAGQAITAARDFSGALAEVSTLIEGTTAEMEKLDAESKRLASTFGGSAAQQAKAFYQAISGGAGDVAEATQLLDAANKLAVGGVTDVTTGVDVLTTAIGAYGKEALSVQQVSDALFVGMKGGKTTIGELAGALGQVVPLSSQLGVSLDETVAAMSAITLQGKTTSVAATQIKSLMEALIRTGDASSAAGKLAKSMGLDLSEAALRTKGLSGVLNELMEATGGNKSAILKLVGSSEALGAVMSLTGAGAENFSGILGDMSDKAGATQTAFEKMAGELDQRLNVQLGKFGNAILVIGGVLLSVAVPAMEAVTATVMFLSNNMDIIASVFAAVAVTQIPALVAGLVALTAGISATGIATAAATGALKLFGTVVAIAGGPISILVALIAGAASYFLLFRDGANKASEGAYNAKAGTDALNTALGTFYQTAAPNAAAGAIDVANANVKMAKSAVDAARAEIMKQKALNQAFLAPDPSGWNAPAEGFIDEIASRTEASNTRLDGLLADLQKATDERKNAANAITGTMSEVMTRDVEDISMAAVNVEPFDFDGMGAGGAGGIGGAAGIENTFAQRMEALMTGLATEREAADLWKQESLATLTEAREMENISQLEHNEYKLRVEQEYQDRLAGIKSEGIAGSLGETSKMFGDWNKLAGGGHKKLLKAEKAFAAAEMLINTYRGAAQVLADKETPWWAKVAAAGSIIAAGMGFIGSIKGGGGSGGGSAGGVSRGASGVSATTTASEPAEPQRVLLDFQGQGLVSVEMLAEIISGIQEESKNGSIIEVVA